ncbi:primase [Bacillus phage SWEP1]|nr:primase [Bacillus phage SWEP1]
MYVRVCPECHDKHYDIIRKKISKGVIYDASITSDKDECYLSHMHEEEAVVKEGMMKINYNYEGKWNYSTGIVDLAGYPSLTALLSAERFVTIYAGDKYDIESSVSTNHISWACKVKDEEE